MFFNGLGAGGNVSRLSVYLAALWQKYSPTFPLLRKSPRSRRKGGFKNSHKNGRQEDFYSE